MSANATPDTPNGYPFAGPSALCSTAEPNTTQSTILKIFMESNFLSEADPTRSKLSLKRCPFHFISFLGFESAQFYGPIVVEPVL